MLLEAGDTAGTPEGKHDQLHIVNNTRQLTAAFSAAQAGGDPLKITRGDASKQGILGTMRVTHR